jgi:hypothetical protein
MRNNAYWLYPGCTGFKNSDCPAINGRFFWVRYAEDFLEAGMKEAWGNTEFCPVVVVNFGQWDLGWPSGYMTRYEEYRKKVDWVLSAFLAVRPRDGLVWVTVNPYPLPQRCAAEWRFLDLIERFNEGARAAAAAYNVTVWDTYDVLKHVFDLTYDGNHYKFPVATGTSLALLLSRTGIWQTIILSGHNGCLFHSA